MNFCFLMQILTPSIMETRQKRKNLWAISCRARFADCATQLALSYFIALFSFPLLQRGQRKKKNMQVKSITFTKTLKNNI